MLPLLALVVRAPWGDLIPLLTRPESLAALRLSLLTSTTAAGLCLLVGVPLALVLARGTGRTVALVRALVVVPLVLPPVVGGVALLLAYGRRGLVGAPLDGATGWSLPFSTPAVVVAEAFVALPFLVIAVEAALRSADPRLAQVAATLGASRTTVLRRVTLPAVAPALAAGTVLCWARALGEFGATVTFAGSLPGTTRVLPTEVVVALETDPAAATALSLLLLAVCWFSEPVTISRAWTFALVWSGLALYLGHLLHRRRRWNPPLLMRLY